MLRKSCSSFNAIDNISADNIAPNRSKKTIFLYLGSFYGSRTPDYLLEGFSLFYNKNPESELHFYGTNKLYVKSIIKSKNIIGKIKFFKMTDKILNALSTANVLIDVDNQTDNQVFLSSKIMDYLSIKRFILAITTKNSPCSKIVGKIPKTALRVSHNPIEIAEGLEVLSLKKWDKDILMERKIQK